MMKELGTKLKEARTRKGFSQEDLAERSQVNLRTIQRIENNQNEPRGKTLNLLCHVLEINTEDLLDYGKHEDRQFIVFFHLSVLTFLVIPLGNIILPLILWLTKKDKIIDLKNVGAALLNFQINWSILSFISIAIYTYMKIMHYGVFEILLYIFFGLQILNITFPIYFAIKAKQGKTKSLYPNLLKWID
ncbi:helix-turn-helix domain-containing protein [Psychroflexus aestuariivivens]|uniref:helix-turn-helix domain-containing protein n=1 Tax=Psychroflexus aestuariivivens TaxID=1795040 RepID=UPI001F024008|nr:helix-turn-helix domain-containing protein [Psychroflexus aestuariivivens]